MHRYCPICGSLHRNDDMAEDCCQPWLKEIKEIRNEAKMNESKSKYSQFKQDIQNIRASIIAEINANITNANALTIQLDSGIIYNYVDDQRSEVISRISTNGNVEIDTGDDIYTIKITDLPSDELLFILHAIESGEYEVEEEIED